MESKITSTINKNHKLWIGDSGSIWMEAWDKSRVCIVSTIKGIEVGSVCKFPSSTSWRPFFGTVELSE